MNPMHDLLPKVRKYLAGRDWSDIPAMSGRRFAVLPLAQGEYNLNYLLRDGSTQLVFRVNMGTQIGREDQIVYEYRALKLLKDSGVTPRPHFVDDSRAVFDRGVLVMAFLEGGAMDYRKDLPAAAAVLAKIHQVEVAPSENHLIQEQAPLSLIYDECAGLMKSYFESDLADPDIRAYLKAVLDWARENCKTERFYQEDPWPCIVNTEVNSGNFIADRNSGKLFLVDWEMPRWGDPSQDLSHFCSPLTTLWKTEYRMSHEVKRRFLGDYKECIADAHLRDTLEDRVRLRDPFVYLRGISWSAMGWAAYQTGFNGVRNPDTWETLQRYMRLDFIRSIFDPVLGGADA